MEHDRRLNWFAPDVRGSRTDGPKRWRRGGGLWLFYLASPLSSAWIDHTLPASVAGTVLVLAFVWCYLFLVPKAWFGHHRPAYGYAIVGVLLALTVLSSVAIGVTGLTPLIFVGTAAIFVLPGRMSLALILVCAVVSSVLPQYVGPWHVRGVQWGLGGSIALASVAVYGFSRLIRANHELAAAREQVAILAAEQERLRIARDLHDLLGHSLTTVTVKAALATRLFDQDPVRARAEIGEVERLARESLADVRAAVAGFRDVRLGTELATAREVLAAAGIEADLPHVVDDVPTELGGLFGWVVREGVTNVVRHSRASRVTITVHTRAIEVVDNGRGCAGGDPGHGLAGLAERAAALGGHLVAGPLGASTDATSTNGFRLRVDVPA
ncbi:MAG: two-component system, NarL family, sensor histidine kinase DesK [Actinomycetota bacterium]|nr:two-component system, NarL family, sensor histidine kinase DesK [Actinomycetota bacterium]